jgi:hypothetical protein
MFAMVRRVAALQHTSNDVYAYVELPSKIPINQGSCVKDGGAGAGHTAALFCGAHWRAFRHAKGQPQA